MAANISTTDMVALSGPIIISIKKHINLIDILLCVIFQQNIQEDAKVGSSADI
jgi:hypothetical protein